MHFRILPTANFKCLMQRVGWKVVSTNKQQGQVYLLIGFEAVNHKLTYFHNPS